MANRKHYYGVMPAWLTDELRQQEQPYSVATDFEKLSSIVSRADVSLYFLYLQNADLYVGDAFSDMTCITELSSNLRWVAENSSAIEKAKALFDVEMKKYGEDLSAEDVPASIKRCVYTAQGVDSNILMLAGSVPPEDWAGSCINPYECIAQLTKQLLFDEYRSFRIMKIYTQTA